MAKRAGGMATYDDVDEEREEEPEIDEMNQDEAEPNGEGQGIEQIDDEGEDTMSDYGNEEVKERKRPPRDEVLEFEQIIIDGSKASQSAGSALPYVDFE